MELLLNLIWLLLIVPAFLVWNSPRNRADRHRANFALLTLICVLALLFPVISATDDMQAMRPEIEEAGNRDAVSNPHHSRIAVLERTPASPALPCIPSNFPELRTWSFVVSHVASFFAAAAATTHAGRAPPRSTLA
jgi:hypothetical protein